MKKKKRFWLLFAMMMLCVAGSVLSASAEETEAVQTESSQAVTKTGWVKEGAYTFYYSSAGKMVSGWKKIGKYIYYFRKKASGEIPAGSRMTGFQKIGNYTYYFNAKGVLLTGWRTIDGKTYYFQNSGKLGTIGRMSTGLSKVNGKYYYFGTEGAVATGWTTIKNKLYYFSKSKTLGTRGSAYTGWKKIGKYRYYFSKKGLRYTSRWINNTYYVDANGRMLTSCVTPDGYLVNASGVKGSKASGWISSDGKYYYYTAGKKATGWKKISGKYYYFDAEGVRQTGWLTVDGATYYLKKYRVTGWKTIKSKKYYFYSNGKMAVSTTIDGYEIGADGVAVKIPETEASTDGKASILLLSGHGQGDTGAVGTFSNVTYKEYLLTREFSTLIYNKLNASGANVSVTMYDQNYDCYQQNASTLGSSGLKLSFTGSGANKEKVLAGIKTNPKLPDFTQYDYVLEIHFNATGTANKDTKGDGKYKGIGMYISSYKKDYAIDLNIVNAVVKQTGFKLWGGTVVSGVSTSSTLYNPKVCQELGVSYGLLETAFIDDKDDMTFYQKNKDDMAQAVADAIVSYFSK
jgi:glucan-binding YG repeat protein